MVSQDGVVFGPLYFYEKYLGKRKTFSPFNDKMGLSDKNNGMITGKADRYGEF